MNSTNRLNSMSVLIPDGGSMDALKILRCLGQAPYVRTHIMSRAHLPVPRFSRYCRHSHYHNSQSDYELIEAIKKVIQRYKIDVLLPATLGGVEFISRNQGALSELTAIPPIARFELLKKCGNKWWLHCFAKGHGLPVLPTIFVGRGKEAIADSAELESFEYPALLKPTCQAGGIGIVKVNNPSDVRRVWKENGIMKDCEYILQRYSGGIDFSLSVCCKHGEIQAYTLWKMLMPSKKPYAPASVVEYIDDDKVVDIGKKLVSALGWDGVADIDLLVDDRDQSMKILEINPRFWQTLPGCIMAGVNFPLLWCLSGLGRIYPENRYHGTKYGRPSVFVDLLISRLRGEKPPVRLSWRESDIRFILKDPLPETTHTFPKLARKVATKTVYHRFKRPKKTA